MTLFLHPHELAGRNGLDQTIRSGGRLRRRQSRGDAPAPGAWHLVDAHGAVRLAGLAEAVDAADATPRADQLMEVEGTWNGQRLQVHRCEGRHQPGNDAGEATRRFGPRDGMLPMAAAAELRAKAGRAIRRYFESQDFLEVDTPHAVASPGTDIYLQPLGTRSVLENSATGLSSTTSRSAPPWLHTSPEFAMKRLLCEGFTRIWQQCKVWRDGEVTDRHNPEFTMLEWYRAWEGPEAVMADVEAIVRAVCGESATVVEDTPDGRRSRRVDLTAPFERITMQELVERACGFDLLEALDYPSLRAACSEHGVMERALQRRYPDPAGSSEANNGRWDELFFELMVTELEPELADMGAVFLTEWPAPLAVLARKKPDDGRVAERFELFVGGLELANGFAELTDPVEQRERFERDLEERQQLDLPALPMPEGFLQALEYGLPPSTGVALGVDRLLMAAVGAAKIREVTPFALSR